MEGGAQEGFLQQYSGSQASWGGGRGGGAVGCFLQQYRGPGKVRKQGVSLLLLLLLSKDVGKGGGFVGQARYTSQEWCCSTCWPDRVLVWSCICSCG
jgi:hypothetical protein